MPIHNLVSTGIEGDEMALVQKTTTVEAIVNLLIDRINQGLYPPGEKLPSERLLQDELGVGRLALREALSRLNAMGIIETSQGKGTWVLDDVKSETFRGVLVPYFALKNAKRLEDLMVARGMLESEIAGLAAQQRSETDLASLYQVVEHAFPATVSLEEVARQDLLFHRMLAEIIDNGFLAKMHEALIDHIRLFLNEYVKSKEGPAEVMRPHLPILHAIEAQDSERARREARAHISYSLQDYERYIQQKQQGAVH